MVAWWRQVRFGTLPIVHYSIRPLLHSPLTPCRQQQRQQDRGKMNERSPKQLPGSCVVASVQEPDGDNQVRRPQNGRRDTKRNGSTHDTESRRIPGSARRRKERSVDTIKFRIIGSQPVMMHNGRLANPLDPYTKACKRISSKTKKSDEDYE